MEPDDKLIPEENAPGGEPAPEYPVEEPALSENPEFVSDEPAIEAVESSVEEGVEAVTEEVETVTGQVDEIPASTTEAQPAEPVQEKPAAGALPRVMVGQPHPKKTFWSKLLPWVIVAVLFYVGGLATLFFALYQPKMEAAKTAAAEQATLAEAAAEADAEKIIDLTNDYNEALKMYQDAQAELDLTKGELETVSSTLAGKEAELTSATTANIAYKFLVDVSSARIAVEQDDTATARQAINFAKADLEELKKTGVTADVLAGFAEKLNEASSNLTLTGIEKTRTALDSLYTNLLLLIDNLP